MYVEGKRKRGETKKEMVGAIESDDEVGLYNCVNEENTEDGVEVEGYGG